MININSNPTVASISNAINEMATAYYTEWIDATQYEVDHIKERAIERALNRSHIWDRLDDLEEKEEEGENVKDDLEEIVDDFMTIYKSL